jgi:hypothetical protein
MNLQEMLGDSYHEGMSIDEINTALSGKKFADLSTGNYVDVNKYNADLKAKDNELNSTKQQLSAKLTDSEKEAADKAADKARIQELEEFIKNQTISSNRDRVESLTGDIRSILNIDNNDTNYNNLLDTLSQGETDTIRSIASYINKIVKDSYEKGQKDATKDNLGNFSKDVKKQGSGKTDDVGEFGKNLAAGMKPTVDSNYYFKNN